MMAKKEQLKLCSECKWSKNLVLSIYHDNWACSNERVGSRIDVVDGQRLYVKCSVAREQYADDGGPAIDKPCGYEGRLWELKS